MPEQPRAQNESCSMSEVAPPLVVVRQRVADFILTYYWLLTLISFLAFSFSGRHSILEWSYYPLYFLIGWLLKLFLQRRIPEAVVDLYQSGSLAQQVYPRLVRELERHLNHRVAITVVGLGGGLFIAAFYWVGYGCTWPFPCARKPSRLEWIVTAVDVLYGYVVGVAVWKAWALARQVRAWGIRGHLTIRPFHPDGCAGLAPVGRLFLFLSLILAPAGVFCAAWLLFGPRELGLFGPALGGGLIVVLAVGIFAFVAPMMRVHRLMEEKARSARAEDAALALAIAELEESLMSRSRELTPEQVQPQLHRLQALRDVYSQRQRIPTWPVDLQGLGTFTISVVLQASGLVAAVTALIKNLAPLTPKQ